MNYWTGADIAIAAATAAVLLICVVTDVRSRRIYNAVTVPFALLGVGLGTYAHGWNWIWLGLLGVLVGLAMFFLSALVGRILGAGDCKLFAAIGALQGPKMLLWCILYSLVAGGVFAVIVTLLRGELLRSFGRVWRSLYMRIFMRVPMEITEAHGQTPPLPYAVAICVGTIVAVWQFHGRL